MLVRPIITYATPIWFNISANSMEHFRRFERSCIRACLNKYRSPESNFEKYYSNQFLYDIVSFLRIDLLIIQLIRGYFSNIITIEHADLTEHLILTREEVKNQCTMGYVTPACFIYLDKLEIIQDVMGTPLIYHLSRNQRDKKILLHPNLNNSDAPPRLLYNQAIAMKSDIMKDRLKVFAYWWLVDNINFEEIRARTRKK